MKVRLMFLLSVFASSAFSDADQSLATVLNPDGAVVKGVSGSFDASGFHLVCGPGGEPLFLPDDAFCSEPIDPPGEQRSDGSWSALGSGVNNWVYTIAGSGSSVYVGGYLTEAGGDPANYVACWDELGTTIEPHPEELPPALQASPNPMMSGTNLSFRSIGASPLTLNVYDNTGRLVRTQDLGTLPIGSHAHYWDGRDGSGSPLASGVYFVRLSNTKLEASTRVVLIR